MTESKSRNEEKIINILGLIKELLDDDLLEEET